MDKSQVAAAFAALSQPLRINALRLFVRAGPDGLPASEIGERLEVRQNTMSANFAVLLRSGLARNERHGRTIRYSADFERPGSLLGFLMDDCCGGRPNLCRPVIDEPVCM